MTIQTIMALMLNKGDIYRALQDDLWANGEIRTIKETSTVWIQVTTTVGRLCKNYHE